jgi:hypothetical protein
MAMVRRESIDRSSNINYSLRRKEMKMYINSAMIQHWIGSDHDSKEEYINLLLEFVNGKYTVEEFRNDVLELWEDTV